MDLLKVNNSKIEDDDEEKTLFVFRELLRSNEFDIIMESNIDLNILILNELAIRTKESNVIFSILNLPNSYYFLQEFEFTLNLIKDLIKSSNEKENKIIIYLDNIRISLQNFMLGIDNYCLFYSITELRRFIEGILWLKIMQEKWDNDAIIDEIISERRVELNSKYGKKFKDYCEPIHKIWKKCSNIMHLKIQSSKEVTFYARQDLIVLFYQIFELLSKNSHT